jgi:hypothetical protein
MPAASGLTASALTATEYEFRHPHGTFPVRCRQLTGEDLAHQLLGAEDSYITIAADRLVEDALPLMLRLVDLGERLTSGIATLPQLSRSSLHRCLQRHGISRLPDGPFLHRLWVQAVSGGKGPGALLRRLELGSKTRRRAGAAVKDTCHGASSS